jgi:predicted permease
LADEGRGASAGRWQRRVNQVFVSAQVAATLALLAAAAVTVRRYIELSRVDPGFNPGSVLSVQLSLPPTRYGSTSAVSGFADRLRERLRASGHVRDVSSISLLPLSGLLSTMDYRVSGRPEPPQDEIPQAHYRIVMPAYFRVMGIALSEGREFTDEDRESSRRVAIVSRALARRHWRAGATIGEHIVVGRDTLEVVGVCADVKQFGLDGAPTADLYVPLRQAPANQAPFLVARTYWVVRADGDPVAIADAVRREIHGVDGEVAASSVRTFRDLLNASIGSRQFNASLLEVLGLSGLLLSMVGVYGVTAFSVRLRSRDIAIRLACGATPQRVVRQILASELPAIVVGLMFGGAMAWALSHDPWIAATIGLALGSIALLACYLPTRRAAAMDPLPALHDG